MIKGTYKSQTGVYLSKLSWSLAIKESERIDILNNDQRIARNRAFPFRNYARSINNEWGVRLKLIGDVYKRQQYKPVGVKAIAIASMHEKLNKRRVLEAAILSSTGLQLCSITKKAD